MSYEVVDLVNDATSFSQNAEAVYVSEVIDLVSPNARLPKAKKQEMSVVDLTASSEDHTFTEVVIEKEIKEIRVPAGVKCPVCLDVREDLISGDCGHALCVECMKKVMQATKKCPACRRKLTKRNLRRIFWTY